MSTVSLAHQAATAIHQAFLEYEARFTAITRRARLRFENREWRQAQEDAVERLTLYRAVVDDTVAALMALLEAQVRNAFVWREIKAVHARLSQGRLDTELSGTFFNSITRRIFTTVGVDPNIEYLDFIRDPDARGGGDQAGLWTFKGGRPTADIVTDIFSSLPFRPEYDDLSRDALVSARAIDRELANHPGRLEAIEILPPVFYRGTAAYVVGRMRVGEALLPLVFAFLHPEEGIVTDAVLMHPNEVSIVFSFTRSYFHVDIERPHLTISVLRSIMPRKPVDELYTAIGFNKHGKTVFYRNLMRHLETTDDRFDIAEGEPGLVMTVFALPAFNAVFKIIRDRFGAPKSTSRETVRARYDLVFVHDRVGRLADAQEFEHLEFDRARFAPALLDELLTAAASSVRVEGERVIIRHLYTERRVTPLNIYLKHAAAGPARDAIVDYGCAIRELAAANIFTGDMLLKNFGVTRNDRVIFYDYDELCLLTECNFRAIPQTDDPLREMSAEPWFSVGERDVFPEEFRPFFVFPGPLGEAFLSRHADLLEVNFWKDMQERQLRGEIVDVLPYREESRLDRNSVSSEQ
ncbi:MAG TPA: bifunctional isocitrate dehydrogenase kinase/phosphatase [Gemmatimonadales bacterium]|nr:bifunctional isocitrate dehydrogenase kinase/phosphatase [Gemmatimonadales bacterium]